jgi:hypothetical protein
MGLDEFLELITSNEDEGTPSNTNEDSGKWLDLLLDDDYRDGLCRFLNFLLPQHVQTG